MIQWVVTINYLDTTLTDKLDCQSKISAFIGYVNKLNVNFGHQREMSYVLCLKHTVVHIIDVKLGDVLLHHILTGYVHHVMLVYV